MKKYIIIKADTNDADYVTSKKLITDEEIEQIKPVVKAIKKFKPYKTNGCSWEHHHNFPAGDCLRDDLGELSPYELYVESGKVTKEQFELFEEYLPYGEYGLHTIESVEILEVENEIKLM